MAAAAMSNKGEPADGAVGSEGGGGGGGGGGEEGATPALLDDEGSVGLPYWERQRSAWVSGELAFSASVGQEGGGSGREKKKPGAGGGARAPVIDPDANYDDLLLTNEPFEVPIPLPEMVDFLVDTWIDDGLY